MLICCRPLGAPALQPGLRGAMMVRLLAAVCAAAAALASTPPPTPPPVPAGVHVVQCEFPYAAYPEPKMCTPGSEVSPANGRCECTEEGYACDKNQGRCRKLKVKVSDDGGGASPIEVFGFILLIGAVCFCLGNLVFYQRKNRLPFWVKNACCTCPPEPSCEDLSKNGNKSSEPTIPGMGKKKNPIDQFGRR